MNIEIDVLPEAVMSPVEMAFVSRAGYALKERLDESVVFSPVKAAVAGAAIGVLLALMTDKSISGGAFYGAAYGGLASSLFRRMVVTGYGCGLCEGMSFGR
jgi:hypothetical protein